MNQVPHNNCVANVKNIKNLNELVLNISELQNYPSTAKNSKSESSISKRISGKVDFNIVKNPSIPLGFKNCENVSFFNPVIQVLYSFPVFIKYINQLRLPVKGVAMKIRKLFKETETSNAPVRMSVYVRYLNPQHFEAGMQYDAHECLLQVLEKNTPQY